VELQSLIAKYHDHFNDLLIRKLGAFLMLQSLNIKILREEKCQEEIEKIIQWILKNLKEKKMMNKLK
jgi:hypothetical protein